MNRCARTGAAAALHRLRAVRPAAAPSTHHRRRGSAVTGIGGGSSSSGGSGQPGAGVDLSLPAYTEPDLCCDEVTALKNGILAVANALPRGALRYTCLLTDVLLQRVLLNVQ
jgi:hypothetical protein